MSSEFKKIIKYCENCGKQLKFRALRDVERKKFCSRKCHSSWRLRHLWKNPIYVANLLKSNNTPEVNKRKASYSRIGAIISPELREKISLGNIRAFLDGKMNNSVKNHKHGHYVHQELEKPIFFRSSYEEQFIKICCESELIDSVIPANIAIKYDNARRYIPDFIVTVGNKKFLVEVKPENMLNFNNNPKKFQAARQYCETHDMQFEVITEKQLYMEEENAR